MKLICNKAGYSKVYSFNRPKFRFETEEPFQNLPRVCFIPRNDGNLDKAISNRVKTLAGMMKKSGMFDLCLKGIGSVSFEFTGTLGNTFEFFIPEEFGAAEEGLSVKRGDKVVTPNLYDPSGWIKVYLDNDPELEFIQSYSQKIFDLKSTIQIYREIKPGLLILSVKDQTLSNNRIYGENDRVISKNTDYTVYWNEKIFSNDREVQLPSYGNVESKYNKLIHNLPAAIAVLESIPGNNRSWVNYRFDSESAILISNNTAILFTKKSDERATRLFHYLDDENKWVYVGTGETWSFLNMYDEEEWNDLYQAILYQIVRSSEYKESLVKDQATCIMSIISDFHDEKYEMMKRAIQVAKEYTGPLPLFEYLSDRGERFSMWDGYHMDEERKGESSPWYL